MGGTLICQALPHDERGTTWIALQASTIRCHIPSTERYTNFKMGCWSFFSCFRGETPPIVKTSTDDDDDDNVPHSPDCTIYQVLDPQRRGYIDRERLTSALTTIFPSQCEQDFGIKVNQGFRTYTFGRQTNDADSTRPMDLLHTKKGRTGRFTLQLCLWQDMFTICSAC